MSTSHTDRPDSGAPREHGRPGHDYVARHDELRCLAPGAGPAVFAARANVTFAAPTTRAGVESSVRAFLTTLADDLAAAGCVLVGHIKGTILADGGCLAFHLTSMAGSPGLEGEIPAVVARATLTVNVIVFGVPESELPELATQAWERSRAPGTTSWAR